MRKKLAPLLLILAISVAYSLAISRVLADPVPGLSLTFESPDGKAVDARVSRLIAICVAKDSNPTPFLSPGPFTVTWRGFINLKIRDQYTFSVAGRGEFELIINGESVLNASGDLAGKSSALIKLRKGANEVIAHYTSPPDGDAVVRLSWAEKNKPAGPIPPMILTHEPDAALQQQTQIRDGRELAAMLRCVRCHAASEHLSSQTDVMPELSIDAPNLDDVGSRLNPKWMARWIANPREVRSDASMPRIFPHDGTNEAVDIAAYLATRRSAAAPSGQLDQTDANVSAGTRLFLNLGCIACHTPPNADIDAHRLSLKQLKSKYESAALRQFLKKPEAHYAWTRMPNFSLSDDEANKLAAYLLQTAPSDAVEMIDMSAASAERGKLLFESSGCVNCHAPAQKSALQSKSVADLCKGNWSTGCLGDDQKQRGRAPDFSLSDEQRASIRAFAKTDWSSMSRDVAPEFAERSIRALNCTACHTRDAQEDTWSKLAPAIAAMEKNLPPEEGPHADQQRPLLTWAGDRLKPQWMSRFIAGEIEYKPRPWLRARMPAFASRATRIAQGLSLQHGWPLNPEIESPADASLVEIGRKLVGRVGGFSCNQCHAVNQTAALVPFDSPAPNVMYAHERLRHDFYLRWTLAPQKYQPGTRMPNYADADGKTPYKDILDGDATKQFESIWEYLKAGRSISPPE